MAKAASTKELTDAIQQATNFKWISDETLPEFKKRWDDLFDIKFPNSGIAINKIHDKCVQILAKMDEMEGSQAWYQRFLVPKTH